MSDHATKRADLLAEAAAPLSGGESDAARSTWRGAAALPPIVHHPAYRAELAGGHAFPMNKYEALARALEAEGLVGPGGFHQPEPASFQLIAATHDPDYVRAVFDLGLPRDMERRIGLPLTPSMLMRSRCSTAGTLLSARLALEYGVACNTAGGSHHAGRAHGSGYCIFNDVAVAATALLHEGEVSQILVVDLDVHQGDGTAEIFADEPRVFTFSMHAAKNFPARKAVGDLDVELEDGLGDEAYLAELEAILPTLLDRVAPELVFLNAGVDPHADDRLGRLAMTDAGLLKRNRYVFQQARSRNVPVCGVVGGGYDRDVERLGARQALLHRAAAEAFAAEKGCV